MRNWTVVLCSVIGAGLFSALIAPQRADASAKLTMVGRIDGSVPADCQTKLAFNFFDEKGNEVYRAVSPADIHGGIYTASLPVGVLEAGHDYHVDVTSPTAMAAASPAADAIVRLQATTPGVQQIGHANISGKLIVGESVVATSTTTTPAVSGTATGSGNTIGGAFVGGPTGIGASAEGSVQGIFARSGSGSGWVSFGFPGSSAVVGDGDYYGVVGKSGTPNGGSGVVGNVGTGNSLTWFVGAGVSGKGDGTASGIGVGGTFGGAAQIDGYLGTNTFGVSGKDFEAYPNVNQGNLGGISDGVNCEAQAQNGNGIVARASNGAAAYGVWGLSSSGYAGVFSGTTQVIGNFYATSKFFRIDHPQDPEHKYLVHACVESDEQLSLYRGSAFLNSKGEAWVDLPGYFSALNGKPGYQLTCVGAYAQVYVSEEAQNRFKIAGGKPNMRVCWMVYGTRRDPYAMAHPMVVEKAKEGDEYGKLLTPLEYGYPIEQGITYEKEQRSLDALRSTPNTRAITRLAK